MLRIERWGKTVCFTTLGLAALASRTGAEIHNGGVDCTNWNGTYRLASASATQAALIPPANDTITIRQESCGGVDMDVTIAGERYTIMARTIDRLNRRSMLIKGRPTRVYANWVDGYGKNWTVSLTPDPLRPGVPYSVREYLLTSFHTVVVQATIHDPRNQIPLATFPEGRRDRQRGAKVRDVVDGRAVYLMPVGSGEVSVQLRGIRRPPRGTTKP
jgi:hypothetical protein